jgi:tetratricopeptide (TPR) repeat protein
MNSFGGAAALCQARLSPSRTQQESIQTSDQAQFNAAMQALDAGHVHQAEQTLLTLHRRHPHLFAINETLGLVEASHGALQEALPLLQTAVHERPQSDVAHANLGTALLKLGRTAQAASELEEAARLNPQNAATESALGQCRMLLKQPQQAAAAFTRALALDPVNPTLLYNAALAQYQSSKPSEAAALLAQIQPQDESAQEESFFGDVEEQLGHFKEATIHYAQAVTLNPDEQNIYVLGIEFLRHWTFDAAIKEFTAGLKKFPSSTRLKAGLGIAYYGAGAYSKAIPVMTALVKQYPSNPVYANILGRSCTVLTSDASSQCGDLAPLARRYKKNATLATYAALGILHQEAATVNLAEAEDLLQQAIAADPHMARAWMEEGLLRQQQSRWAESIAPLKHAIHIRPDFAQAHYRLALAYSHTGQHQKAQEEVALDQHYSKEQEQSLDARMRQITTLVVTLR